jgi:glyoxylase-like metal-dependent hydrolase (beta-lactamase superfamily II)
MKEVGMGLKFRMQAGLLLGALSGCLMLFGSTEGICAEQLKPKSQVPGYYRAGIGQFQVTAIQDGISLMSRDLFFGISETEKEELLSRMFITGDIPSSVNAYLINTGTKLVLVDAGAGSVYGSTLGHLPENLRAAGYKPCQIDAVLITHAHPDHIGGLLDDKDKPVYPKATVYISVPESDFWMSEENEANAPEMMKSLFALVQKTAAIYSAGEKWKTFYDGEAPIPGIAGITAILTPGHSAGMAAFEISSNDQKLLLWGDIVHASAIQMPNPFVSFAYDLDYGGAISSRLGQLECVAAEKGLVAGSHLAFPGFGHVRKDGQQSFTWVPVDFSVLP